VKHLLNLGVAPDGFGEGDRIPPAKFRRAVK
jgi:hypothetical protein